MSPTKEQMSRFAADCNQGGLCHFDMESAIRNHIIPSMFEEDKSLDRQPAGADTRTENRG